MKLKIISADKAEPSNPACLIRVLDHMIIVTNSSVFAKKILEERLNGKHSYRVQEKCETYTGVIYDSILCCIRSKNHVGLDNGLPQD